MLFIVHQNGKSYIICMYDVLILKFVIAVDREFPITFHGKNKRCFPCFSVSERASEWVSEWVTDSTQLTPGRPWASEMKSQGNILVNKFKTIKEPGQQRSQTSLSSKVYTEGEEQSLVFFFLSNIV